jgi:hypothetical protein
MKIFKNEAETHSIWAPLQMITQGCFLCIKIGFFPVSIVPCIYIALAKTPHKSYQCGIPGTHGCMGEKRK